MSYRSLRKGNGQQELQEEAGKSLKKYSCKHKQTWEKDFPFICKSHKGNEYAKCNFCRIDISVVRGQNNDVTKHQTRHLPKIIKRALQPKKEIKA